STLRITTSSKPLVSIAALPLDVMRRPSTTWPSWVTSTGPESVKAQLATPPAPPVPAVPPAALPPAALPAAPPMLPALPPAAAPALPPEVLPPAALPPLAEPPVAPAPAAPPVLVPPPPLPPLPAASSSLQPTAQLRASRHNRLGQVLVHDVDKRGMDAVCHPWRWRSARQ